MAHPLAAAAAAAAPATTVVVVVVVVVVVDIIGNESFQRSFKVFFFF